MRPVAHTLIESVQVPMAQLFAFLASPGRMPDWLPDCTRVEYEAPLKRGAKFTARFGERVSEFEVVDYAPPATFGWAERSGRRGSKIFFRLDGNSGLTALTIREVWTPRSLLAWLVGHVRQRREVTRPLKNVAERVRNMETACGLPAKKL